VIQSFTEQTGCCTFYDSNGTLNKSALERLLQRKPAGMSLLGWYRFRSGTPLRPSMRELFVHQQLNHKDPQVAQLLGMFTYTSQDAGATHTFDYKILQPGDIRFGARFAVGMRKEVKEFLCACVPHSFFFRFF
jgi:hypothetical protein